MPATPATEAIAEANADFADAGTPPEAGPTENGPVGKTRQEDSPAPEAGTETSLEDGGTTAKTPPVANGVFMPQAAEEAEPPHLDAATASAPLSVADKAPTAAVEQRELPWIQSVNTASVDQAQQDK